MFFNHKLGLREPIQSERPDRSRGQNKSLSQTLTSFSFDEGAAYLLYESLVAPKIPRGIDAVLKTKQKLF